jgi:hypothetical protein
MSLARLRGKKDTPNDEFVNDDFKEMQESIAEQAKAGEGTWVECFTGQPSNIPRLVYRTFLGCALQFLQQCKYSCSCLTNIINISQGLASTTSSTMAPQSLSPLVSMTLSKHS